MGSFVICSAHHILLGYSNHGRWWRAYGTYRRRVRKTAVKRPLGRSRHRWENKIKMYFNVNGGHGLDLLGFRIEVSGGLL
jgi:hypothetical protein